MQKRNPVKIIKIYFRMVLLNFLYIYEGNELISAIDDGYCKID